METDQHVLADAPALILVVGLPETGKSSFIQALDEVLKHPKDANDLRSAGLADDRSYLQSGKADYLAGRKLSRTLRPQVNTSVELCFTHPPTGLSGRLHLPDRNGEIFQDQWVNRRWETRYRESLNEISAALIFVRADEKSRNDELLGVLAADVTEATPEPQEFRMKDASAQVQLVEVLQFISENGDIPQPLRVAVIISAWDTVGGNGDLRPLQPPKFLAREWPLLSQYLLANPERYVSRIYGVSAYGGKPNELGELLDQPPHERVTITDGEDSSRDLTRPLRWILEIG